MWLRKLVLCLAPVEVAQGRASFKSPGPKLRLGGQEIIRMQRDSNLGERATLFEDLDAKMSASRGRHFTQHIAPAECPMPQADNCVRQVDNLQSVAAPPSSLPYNPKTLFDKGVADFCMIGEGLKGDFVILDKGHSYGFLFTYEGPLVHRFNKTWPGNDVQTLLSTQLLLNRIC